MIAGVSQLRNDALAALHVSDSDVIEKSYQKRQHIQKVIGQIRQMF